MRNVLQICTPATFDVEMELADEQRIIPRHIIPYVRNAKLTEQGSKLGV
jgi:hypothetical protein